MKTHLFDYFTKKQWCLVLFLLLMGLFLRWYQLDVRPYHHDEALHAIHGYYIYSDPEHKYYRYNPLLHGPLLYNLLPFVYDTFGISNWSGRMLMALLGSLMIFVPLLFRRYFTPPFLIVLTAFLSLSPSLIYWSRFLCHDFLMISCMAAMLYAVAVSEERYKGFLFAFAFILAFCIKANSYITLLFLLVFLAYEFILSPKENLLFSLFRYLRRNYLWTLGGLLCGAFIFCWLYSSFFRHWDGVLDGIYRKSLAYWWNQHEIERIKGPFLFYFFNLSWYELAFVSLLFIQLIHIYWRAKWYYLVGTLFSLFFGFYIFFFYEAPSTLLVFVKSFFKLKFPLDGIAPFFIMAQGVLLTTYHLLRKEKLLAFFAYWFWGAFFTYSFLGEKVPWLMSYIFIPGLIYLHLYWQKNFPLVFLKGAKILFVLFIIFNLRMSIITNFSRAGGDTEYISQVHTTEAFHQVAQKLRYEMTTGVDAKKTTNLTLDDSVWPLSWYLRDLYPQYQFSMPLYGGLEQFDYVIMGTHNSLRKELEKTHQTYFIPLRHWWVPDFPNMTFKNFLVYAFFHVPWNSPGSLNIIFSKKR